MGKIAAALVLMFTVVTALTLSVIPGSLLFLNTPNPKYVVPPGSTGRELFVAPDGTSSNDGSKERPLDLATVFGNPRLVRPGDTVWLRGGLYKVAVTSELIGEPDAPIVVRQYPGERAILDAASPLQSALIVKGSDTWYWDFEVTDSHPTRITKNPTYTEGLRATSVTVFGPRTRFINMVVHDGEQGFGFWSAAVDAELYGNLIYNVGFEAGDRGHGHSIYAQNEKGGKRIVDNIFFNGHSFGLHAYTEGGYIDNLHVEGNIAFNHGLLSRSGPMSNYLFRSKNGPPQNPTLVSNYGYYAGGHPGRIADLTTPVPLAKGCTNAVLTDNYFAAPSMALAMTCQSIRSIRGNTFYGVVVGITPSAYPDNRYLLSKPTETEVFVRANLYEPGRAHLVVYNWDHQRTVAVNLRGIGLQPGDRYEIRDAQNYFAQPLVTGRYAPWSRAVIPMEGLTAAAPVGDVAVKPRHTAPEFGAFIVLKSGPADRTVR